MLTIPLVFCLVVLGGVEIGKNPYLPKRGFKRASYTVGKNLVSILAFIGRCTLLPAVRKWAIRMTNEQQKNAISEYAADNLRRIEAIVGIVVLLVGMYFTVGGSVMGLRDATKTLESSSAEHEKRIKTLEDQHADFLKWQLENQKDINTLQRGIDRISDDVKYMSDYYRGKQRAN